MEEAKNSKMDSSGKEVNGAGDKGGLSKMFTALKQLQGKSMSEWNDANAHFVYEAFKVKRYFVDPDYVLCPAVSDNSGRTVPEILQLCDDPNVMMGRRKSWLEFQPKMNRLLQVFQGDVHLILNGLSDPKVLEVVKKALLNNIEYLKEHPEATLDSAFRDEEELFHDLLKDFLQEVNDCMERKQDIRETLYETYFDHLVDLFENTSGIGIKSKKTILSQKYELQTPSLGKTIPEPVRFLTDSRRNVLAILEVKNATRRRRAAIRNGNQATESGKAPEKVKQTSHNDAAEEDVEEGEKLCDQFDENESQVEDKQTDALPKHIGPLDNKEKRLTRCFLPELFGAMLACTSIKEKCIPSMQKPYSTLTVGIGVQGLQVRFVTLVLRDMKKQVMKPTAADIEKSPSVKPFVYLTRPLNLFDQKDVAVVFQTLFAIRSLGNL